MDMPWGDITSKQFITNVGLVTTKGPYGDNIMACEWTHLVSYRPAIVAVCIGHAKASAENISKSKEFGVSLASSDLSKLSSIAGNSHGQNYDKISAAKELGFRFYNADKINVLMVHGASLNMECKLIKEMPMGDHTMFFGEVLNAKVNQENSVLAYHKVTYGTVVHDIPKPSEEEKEHIKNILEKHKKIIAN